MGRTWFARARCVRAERRSGVASSRGARRSWRWRGRPTRIEEALELATSLREESSAPERAWTCGIAEGELEPLAQDGQRMHLAWGEALVSAASLARVAKAGEVLVDGDVRALRAGQLALIGARSSTDAGQRVRGWRLDLDRPWKDGPPVLTELENEEREETASTRSGREDTASTQSWIARTRLRRRSWIARTRLRRRSWIARTRLRRRSSIARTRLRRRCSIDRRRPRPGCSSAAIPRRSSRNGTRR